jgi:hypothetical protein
MKEGMKEGYGYEGRKEGYGYEGREEGRKTGYGYEGRKVMIMKEGNKKKIAYFAFMYIYTYTYIHANVDKKYFIPLRHFHHK